MIELGKGNVAVDKSFELALGIIDYCELLSKQDKKVVANQLLRSGTSAGALKEAIETLYWLALCERSTHLPTNTELKYLCEEVIKIVSKIVTSTRKQ